LNRSVSLVIYRPTPGKTNQKGSGPPSPGGQKGKKMFLAETKRRKEELLFSVFLRVLCASVVKYL
jgi:hypothetical protein